jgi:hypothetical protein
MDQPHEERMGSQEQTHGRVHYFVSHLTQLAGQHMPRQGYRGGD